MADMMAEDIGLHPDFLRRMEQERALDATLNRLSASRRDLIERGMSRPDRRDPDYAEMMRVYEAAWRKRWRNG